MEKENSILKEQYKKIEKRLAVDQDERLSFFSRAVRSVGKHSVASRLIRNSPVYNNRCAFCGNTPVTMAHIVAGDSEMDYSPFSRGYVSKLDVKSPRNFLPLCGTLGSYGSCHDEFDKFRLTLLYRPFQSTYTIFSFV